ncbi:MAG: 3-dehydroquinate synthase [Deltaproteobacteria bacterium]|nr:3-dehydroquinate synthase [Deltaproteobacteria bacterium]
MEKIKVKLDKREDRSYSILIGSGLLDTLGQGMEELGFAGSCALVTNKKVGALYAGRAIKSLKAAGFKVVTVELPDGEQYKSLSSVSRIYDCLIKNRMERTSAVIALGGGIIGDMAGFAAASYLRGVPYVQVPTTLLSQVDSSVGGKTGVNHRLGKNLIGAFYQPSAVFIDTATLSTLDKREFKAGLAEVVKYGVIRDKSFFSFLDDNAATLGASNAASSPALIDAIARSCAVKAEIVGLDERESGIRSILNFGHTFGHAIEAATGYKKYKHGEAVAIGMVMAAEFSRVLGLTTTGTVERIVGLSKALGLPTSRKGVSATGLLKYMRLDKKVKAGAIRFVLVKALGKVVLQEAGEAEIRGFLANFRGF